MQTSAFIHHAHPPLIKAFPTLEDLQSQEFASLMECSAKKLKVGASAKSHRSTSQPYRIRKYTQQLCLGDKHAA
eukprot:7698245-Karenia_brevis.AAC.1